VYRLETYGLQPTFPLTGIGLPDGQNDAMIYVVDETFDISALVGVSEKDVVEKFEIELQSTFKSLHGQEKEDH
jgi:hypothetical protein